MMKQEGDKPTVAQFDLGVLSRSELEAEIVTMAKIIERFRSSLGGIVMSIEDEGDRTYFGSTNDSDDLRAIEGEMLDALNGLETPWMHGHDLHADLRELRKANVTLEAEIARLRAELARTRLTQEAQARGEYDALGEQS